MLVTTSGMKEMVEKQYHVPAGKVPVIYGTILCEALWISGAGLAYQTGETARCEKT